MHTQTDVVIIGAGPSGSVAASYLADRGYAVEVVERAVFPRFSIGESMLPQSMGILEEVGLLDAVVAGGFQLKNGAVFSRGDDGEEQTLDFRDKSSPGWDTTFQVKREIFDEILAKGAAAKGANVTFDEEVTAFESDAGGVTVHARTSKGAERTIKARFALDASGFGRVLARLKSLDVPSDFPVRKSVFCHVRDHISDSSFDREKILICVHPTNTSIWYWLIPLAGGLSSIGAVGPQEDIDAAGQDAHEQLFNLIGQQSRMAHLLAQSELERPANTLMGFSRNVKQLTGPGFALLGNAAEFLDPVFSSGVTIALRSAVLAANTLDRQLKGEAVDWHADFEAPLMVGVNAFRAYVAAWYDTTLQEIIFSQPKNMTDTKRKIISVLAGYAWDESNPFVREPKRYLNAVRQLSGSEV